MPDHKLSSLPRMQTIEISLVKRGANKKKRFPITKAEGSEMPKEDMDKILAAVLETEVEKEDEITKGLSAKGASAAKSALRLLASFKDELPKDILSKLAKLAGMETEVEKSEDEAAYTFPDITKNDVMKKWAEEMPEELRVLIAPVDKSDDGAEGEKEDDMTDEMKAVMKAHQDEMSEVKKALKVETDKRVMAEWNQRVEKELSHYPGKSSGELAVMLKTLEDTNPEIAEAQFTSMKSASDALKNSEMLSVKGATVAGSLGGSAWEKIQTLADTIVQKSEAGMSKSQAIARVLDTQPELYAEYLEENPKQTL